MNILDLMPEDTPGYMAPEWLGCIGFALRNDEIVAAFREETGNKWIPGRSPLDRMVDEACKADENFFTEFVKWVNVNVWGPLEHSPDEAGAVRIPGKERA